VIDHRWTDESTERAVAAADAFREHRRRIALARAAARGPESHGATLPAGYEPSHPAPRHAPLLAVAIAALGCVVIAVAVWRRLRVESRIALFALALAGTALLMGWPR
jgi:hypothetical protein